MEIFLIRHTSVKIDKGICYGFSDVELSDQYINEFEILKNKLNNDKDLIYFTSPLKRCLELARYLSNDNYNVDNRLKELNFGDWELKKWNLISGKDYDNWVKDYVNYKCPDGENFLDLYNRSIDFYNEIIKKDIPKVAIITHGGVIKSIIASVLKVPLELAPRINTDTASISKIIINKALVNVSYINR